MSAKLKTSGEKLMPWLLIILVIVMLLGVVSGKYVGIEIFIISCTLCIMSCIGDVVAELQAQRSALVDGGE